VATVSQVSVTQITLAPETVTSAVILSILLQTDRALKCKSDQLLSSFTDVRGLARFPDWTRGDEC
jgi:hypothetical protein